MGVCRCLYPKLEPQCPTGTVPAWCTRAVDWCAYLCWTSPMTGVNDHSMGVVGRSFTCRSSKDRHPPHPTPPHPTSPHLQARASFGTAPFLMVGRRRTVDARAPSCWSHAEVHACHMPYDMTRVTRHATRNLHAFGARALRCWLRMRCGRAAPRRTAPPPPLDKHDHAHDRTRG